MQHQEDMEDCPSWEVTMDSSSSAYMFVEQQGCTRYIYCLAPFPPPGPTVTHLLVLAWAEGKRD